MKLYKRIPIGKGLYTLVDFSDVKKLKKYNWRIANNNGDLYVIAGGYAKGYKRWGRRLKRDFGRCYIFIHRFLLDLDYDTEILVDHKNGDGLDNRRSNLRIANRHQNGANSKISKNNTTGFKGVHWNRYARKYSAQIRVHKRQIHLGYFLCSEDAALAYNIAAKKFFGEFARLNKI